MNAEEQAVTGSGWLTPARKFKKSGMITRSADDLILTSVTWLMGVQRESLLRSGNAEVVNISFDMMMMKKEEQ